MTLKVFRTSIPKKNNYTINKPPKSRGWIGVDLDGTLARYDGWKKLTHIGDPIEPVVAKVKEKLREGVEIRIFSARVFGLHPKKRKELEKAVSDWCEEHLGRGLMLTCVKDQHMIELWDDRAVAVEKNTGRMVCYKDGCLQEL